MTSYYAAVGTYVLKGSCGRTCRSYPSSSSSGWLACGTSWTSCLLAFAGYLWPCGEIPLLCRFLCSGGLDAALLRCGM
eukprot:2725499-Amphidinium_carterae.2